MIELRSMQSPQCCLLAANTHADMQPHLTSSLRGTPVISKTGSPSSSLGAIACRTAAKPMLVLRHCGDRANYLTQELDMEITSITTTSTELHTPDIKMIDFNQLDCSVFPSEIIGSVEDSVHQDQAVGTSKTAIFDVQSEPSMDSGRGLLPYQYHENLTLSPSVCSMIDSVLSSGKPTLPTPPCVSSMVDSGLFSEGPSHSRLPCVSGIEESVLPFERPISPSDFFQNNTAPSSQPQMQDSEIHPDILNEIDQLLVEMPVDMSWDCTQQLDLNLFSQFEEPNTLNNIMQECGIMDEMKEESHVHCDGDMSKIREERHIHREGHGPAIKKESSVHCEGGMSDLAVPITMAQPSGIQKSNSVGPVRARQTRRDHRKPVRYRVTKSLDDESIIAEVTVKANGEDLVASASGTTLTGKKNDGKELSNEEKYIKSREQNNIASKRCRQKRKKNLGNMEIELEELVKRNKDLQDKVARLTSSRDEFKDFVNKFLFQRMTQKNSA